MKKYLLLLLFLAPLWSVAQPAETTSTTKLIQPTVMVIPFVKEDQDMREIYEHNHGGPIRAAITRVKDGLDKKGIQTIDFRAMLRQLGNQKAMTTTQQSSMKQSVIALSTADIYIESETQVVRTPRGNSVTVILTAYDAFTGASLVNHHGYADDY